MKKIICLIFCSAFLVSFPVAAQQMFKGVLMDWEGGTAQVVSMGGEPVPVGTITDSGEFQIPLEDNFLEKIENAVQAFNEGPRSGSWKLNTLKRAFSCYSDTLEISNGDQKAVTLATFAGTFALMDLKEKELRGHFMVVNSFDFVKAISTYKEMNAVKGYYIDWYFVNEPAKIQGECNTKSYALNQEEFYNELKVYKMDFKQGWNLVKVSAEGIFTDKDDNRYVSRWVYSTIPQIPENAKYLYFPEENR